MIQWCGFVFLIVLDKLSNAFIQDFHFHKNTFARCKNCDVRGMHRMRRIHMQISSTRRSFSIASGSIALSNVLSSFFYPSKAYAEEQLTYETALSTLLVAKDILVPSYQYFKLKQYDAARTNVNYITRLLGIRKAISVALTEGSAFCDDTDLLEEAAELAVTADSTFTNYDTSIYTMIFIPAEEYGAVSNTSEKFETMAEVYYKQCMYIIDAILSLAPDDVRKRARLNADNRIKLLPKFLFKDFVSIGKV